MKQIYLVTGAAGNLGSEVCRQLVSQGKKVRALVLPGDTSVKYLPKEVEIISGDLLDLKSLDKLYTVSKDTETFMLHLASIVYLDEGFNQKVYDVNVTGTENIINKCLEHPECKKMIYCSSTSTIKELPKGQIIKEVDDFSNTDVLVGYYSKTKAMATEKVLKAVKEQNLNACVVHPSGILGPGDNAISQITSTIISIVKGEMSSGINGSFNLADVRDLADGIIKAVDKGQKGECYILANEEIKFKDFAKIIAESSNTKGIKSFLPLWLANIIASILEKQAKKTGKKPLMSKFQVYNLARNNNFSSEKAKKELGYKTRSTKETIVDEINWLKEINKI